MTAKRSEKTRARALQEDTGWAYSECLRQVRSKTEEQIDELIVKRKGELGRALRERAVARTGT